MCVRMGGRRCILGVDSCVVYCSRRGSIKQNPLNYSVLNVYFCFVRIANKRSLNCFITPLDF